MPRLFTGLELPDGIAQRLAMRRGGLPGARWIDPADYHVTLSFIGDIDDRTANDAVESLASVRKAGFDLSITDLDAFGGDRPRSVHAVVAPSNALLDLQAAQDFALRRVGVSTEGRQYRPHVTLARLGPGASTVRVAEWLTLHVGEPLVLPVRSFALFSSRESVGGGPYIVEERFALLPPVDGARSASHVREKGDT